MCPHKNFSKNFLYLTTYFGTLKKFSWALYFTVHLYRGASPQNMLPGIRTFGKVLMWTHFSKFLSQDMSFIDDHMPRSFSQSPSSSGYTAGTRISLWNLWYALRTFVTMYAHTLQGWWYVRDTYVCTYVRTRVRAYVRACVRAYVRTYVRGKTCTAYNSATSMNQTPFNNAPVVIL